VTAVGLQYWDTGVALEIVRFAGANRLLVEFACAGRSRRVEPYSLRRSSSGRLLLYGWEAAADQVEVFDVAEMGDVRGTSTPFTPRFRLELAVNRQSEDVTWRPGEVSPGAE